MREAIPEKRMQRTCTMVVQTRGKKETRGQDKISININKSIRGEVQEMWQCDNMTGNLVKGHAGNVGDSRICYEGYPDISPRIFPPRTFSPG